MTKSEEAKFLLVEDGSVTAEYSEREHVIIVEGRHVPVVFKLGEPKILPFIQGAKFFNKDGFTVSEADGTKIDVPAVATDNVAAQLASDECVAKFSELSFSALKLRAAQKKDGEIYLDAKAEAREDVIAFLIGEAPEVVEEEIEEIDLEAEVETEEEETEDESGEEETETEEETFTLDEVKGATDAALTLAVSYNIEIADVEGTGSDGNVLKSDVEAFIAEHDLSPVEEASE